MCRSCQMKLNNPMCMFPESAFVKIIELKRKNVKNQSYLITFSLDAFIPIHKESLTTKLDCSLLLQVCHRTICQQVLQLGQVVADICQMFTKNCLPVVANCLVLPKVCCRQASNTSEELQISGKLTYPFGIKLDNFMISVDI